MKRRDALFTICGAAVAASTPWSARAAIASSNPRVDKNAGRNATPQRVVVLDWGLTEMLLSVGVVPVGAANTHGFARNYPACPIPASVVDLGLMFQPNLELLLKLDPDLILITPAHAALRGTLERIAPTATMGLYRSSPTPYTAMRAETLQLADTLGTRAHAQALFAQADKVIAATRATLLQRPLAARVTPLYLVHFLDESRLRVYGSGSWYGELLTQLDVRNAWQEAGHGRAYVTTGLDTLASQDNANATLAYLGPLSPLAANMMRTSPIWRAMPFEQAGKTLALPGVPPDAGLLSAMSFVQAVGAALMRKDSA